MVGFPVFFCAQTEKLVIQCEQMFLLVFSLRQDDSDGLHLRLHKLMVVLLGVMCSLGVLETAKDMRLVPVPSHLFWMRFLRLEVRRELISRGVGYLREVLLVVTVVLSWPSSEYLVSTIPPGMLQSMVVAS